MNPLAMNSPAPPAKEEPRLSPSFLASTMATIPRMKTITPRHLGRGWERGRGRKGEGKKGRRKEGRREGEGEE